METAHRKSPDFTSLENSPPHFTYEFDPTNPTFDGFSSYIYQNSPRMDFASLSLGTPGHAHPSAFFAPPTGIFPNTAGSRAGGSPTSLNSGPHTPLENTTIAPPLTYPHEVSGSELDPMEETPGSGSTSPVNGRSAPHHQAARAVNRYNPIPPRPTRAASKRSATATRRNLRREDDDMSDDDCDANTEDPSLSLDVNGNIPTPEIIGRRREEIRRQRIESEQRRRDELREGYAKLKHTLPVSNQKSSKVSLLDRAVTYIRQLEANQATLTTRLNNSEDELRRQRDVNENLMRTLTEQHRAVGALAAAHAATSGTNLSEPSTPEGSKKSKRQSL